jgi:hypothetical protein
MNLSKILDIFVFVSITSLALFIGIKNFGLNATLVTYAMVIVIVYYILWLEKSEEKSGD